MICGLATNDRIHIGGHLRLCKGIRTINMCVVDFYVVFQTDQLKYPLNIVFKGI